MSTPHHFWYYILLLLLVAVEGELAILAGAGAAASGVLDPRAVLLVAALGNILADTFWFLLGYHSRLEAALRRLPWLDVSEQRLAMLKGLIHRDIVKLLVIAKVTNWMTIPALVAVGAARVPWRRWFPIIVLSDLLIAVIMAPIGYYATASLLQVQKGAGYVALGATLLLALLGAFYGRRWLQKINPLARPAEENLPLPGNETMRILMCSTAYYPHLNGQAVFTTKLSQGLAACGHQVMALVPHEPGLARRETIQGVEVVRVPALHLYRIHQDLNVPVQVASIVRQTFDQFQPHIVHVHDPSPLSEAAMRQARRLNVPVLATHHVGPAVTSPYFSTENRVLSEVVTRTAWRVLLKHLARADLVAVPSAFSASMLAARGLHTPTRVIPCGVQLDEFHPDPALDRQAVRLDHGLDAGKTLFLYVGRIDFEKRLELIVRALAVVANDDVQFAMAGSGTEEEALRRLAEELGVSRQIRFLGQVDHHALPALLNCADVFVMPGDSESFSIATLEAMACGKPILAVDAGALPQLVTHGVNGYLYAQRQPESAARAIEMLAGDPQLRRQMGSASAERASQFSQANTVRVHQETYRDILALAAQPSTKTAGSGGLTPADLRGVAQRPARAAHFRLSRIGQKLNALPSSDAKQTPLRRRSRLMPLVLAAAVWLLLVLGMVLVYDHAQARSHVQLSDLAPLDWATGQRLMVIAPHPDDELLAAGGLIQRTLASNGQVHVVIVTNGDGQDLAPLVVDHKVRPRQDDYVNVGRRRQVESLDALEALGVP